MSGNEDNPPSAAHDPGDPPPPRSRGEKIFLAALISATLLAAILFLALTAWGIFIPAMGIAILTAIGVATLVYAFLGGRGSDSFAVRGMQLTGAAAVFAIVVYIVNGSLDTQLKNVDLLQKGRDTDTLIRAANDRARAAEQRAADLQNSVGESQANTAGRIIALVRASNAATALGRGVLDLYRRGAGPFNRSIRTANLTVRFNPAIPAGSFQYCHDKLGDDFAGPVRFEVVDRETGTASQVTLEGGEDIGQGICSQIQFDAKLGCDAARALFPASTESCPTTDRIVPLVATILNPDLVPRSSLGSNSRP